MFIAYTDKSFAWVTWLFHLLEVFQAVGHEKQFVPGVKLHETPDTFLLIHRPAVASAGEDPFDEILPQDSGRGDGPLPLRVIKGKCSMKIRAKTPTPIFLGIPLSSYTFTRSIPLDGESLLKMKPQRFSLS